MSTTNTLTEEEARRLASARARGGRRAVVVQTTSAADTSSAQQYPKSEEDLNRINDALSRNCLFSSLERGHRIQVALYMQPVHFSPGEAIITQGDSGNTFYVLKTGSVDIFQRQKDGTQKFLVSVDADHAGSFGELAAMYNAPRAATVVAREHCDAWAIEGPLFRAVLREAVLARRRQYLSFIEHVPALQILSEDDRYHLADALRPEEFKKGDVIVKQNEIGDKFYFIVSGMVRVSRVAGATSVQDAENADWGKEVAMLGANSWFGEGALLSPDSRRNATCIAAEPCVLASLDRSSFLRLSTSGIAKDLAKGRE